MEGISLKTWTVMMPSGWKGSLQRRKWFRPDGILYENTTPVSGKNYHSVKKSSTPNIVRLNKIISIQ